MYRSLSMKDFEKIPHAEQKNVLDVRDPEEYQSGHLAQAENIPLDTLADQLDVLDKQKEYYIVCRTGRRSEMASTFLDQKGYQVVNISDGMAARATH